MSVSRTRNYACVVYPESAPLNWIGILSESKVPCFISPLHDRDKNPNDEDKKMHYHVLVMFDSVKTESQAKEFFSTFNGVGCEVVASCRAYARYLCHLDNPEKAQYSIEDVIQYGGADYLSVIGTMSDIQRCIKEMMLFVNDNQIISFHQLLTYAADNRSEWFDALCHHCSYVMREYIKSKFWYDHL